MSPTNWPFENKLFLKMWLPQKPVYDHFLEEISYIHFLARANFVLLRFTRKNKLVIKLSYNHILNNVDRERYLINNIRVILIL